MTAVPLRTIAHLAPAAPKSAGPFSRKTAIAVGAAVLIAAAGVAYVLAPKSSVTTDAAYLQADSAAVAPRVRGLVSAVLVQNNQAVRLGDPLIQIDPEEFDTRVAAATAELATAQAAVDSAKAAFVTQAADENLEAANVRAADTLIASSDAQRERAEADRRRYESLTDSGAVSRREADLAKANAISAGSDAQHSRAVLAVSQGQAALTIAKRASLRAGLGSALAAVARAQAALELARQDQAHALIRAPIDGVVGDRQAEPGDYVQPGTRLLTLVPIRSLYVTANFKETQVGRMLVGQPAGIKVDALPGRALTGRVESFAPGSGSQFSLLPFEPGTGNFTKIVQRVPVRIRFDAGQAGLDRLRPGLSSTVTVSLSR